MKYLLTSDLHIHPHFNNNLFIDVGVHYLEHIEKYCKKNDISTIFLLGDVFHISSKINIEIFIPVFEQFEKMKKKGLKLIMIPGNHEILAENKKTILNILSPFSEIYDCYSIPDLKDDKVSFHMLPFKRKYDFDEYNILIDKTKYNILLTHMDIANFKMSANSVSKGVEDRTFFKKYDWTFSGHYHIHQHQDNIVYIGSPYQQNFGEAGDYNKGFVIYDSNTNTWELIKYENAPKFKILTPEQSLKEDLTNCFLKLKIKDKIDNLSKLREVLNDKGALDIKQEFDNSDSIKSVISELKPNGNNSINDIVLEIIDKEEGYDKKTLIDIFEKIKGV